MPLYIYKAVTEKGQIVRNRVEERNKHILLKRLKNNKLMPIQVTQIKVNRKASKIMKNQKRNIESSDSVLKTVREQEIARNLANGSKTSIQKLKKALFSNINISEFIDGRSGRYVSG